MNKYRKISILHIANTLDMGGTEKNLLSIIKRLDRNKFNIFLAYSYGGSFEEEFKKTGAILYKLQSSKLRFRDFRNISVVPKLVRFIKRNKIDILHTHLFVSHLWGLIAAKITKTPIINHIHGSPIYTKLDGNPNAVKGHPSLEKILVSLTDLNIVITKAMMQKFMDLGLKKEKFILIPNGIDLPKEISSNNLKIEDIKKEFNILDESIICTVGRFDLIKNQQLLLKCIPSILIEFPTTKFLIVGDGPLKSDLEELSKKMGLIGNIIFTGYRTDIYSILAICDIFVLPSKWELHPITILEAMTMKKPVIASAVGGIPDTVIHNKTGLLIPPNDEGALKEAIIQLLQNKEKAKIMGIEGYRVVEENFSNEKVVNKIEQLYLEILNKNKSFNN